MPRPFTELSGSRESGSPFTRVMATTRKTAMGAMKGPMVSVPSTTSSTKMAEHDPREDTDAGQAQMPPAPQRESRRSRPP